jgi:hypothetical protein
LARRVALIEKSVNQLINETAGDVGYRRSLLVLSRSTYVAD